MNKVKTFLNKASLGFVPLLILIWVLWMPDGVNYRDTYRSTNLIMGLMGLFAFYLVKKNNESTSLCFWKNVLAGVFSLLFAVANILGAWTTVTEKNNILLFLAFLGAFCTAYSVIYLLLTNELSAIKKPHNLKLKPSTVFLICFVIVSVIDLTLLFLGFYPGNLSPDSITQVTQILTGTYKNHHPFYHTIVIGALIKLGQMIFGNINAGIACYHIFQIFAVSAVFSFAIVTLYQKKAPLWVIISAFLLYAVHPINILYSFTMWKDVLFGAAALLFITSFARIFFKIGNKNILNYILVFLGGFGFCLWRSNGLYAFILTAILLLIIFYKQYKVLTVGFIVIAICSYILIGPVLRSANISPPDTIEHLSVPAQQIARVVADDCRLSDKEYETLSKVIAVEDIPSKYKDYISDPIKNLVRASNGNDYIAQNKKEFLKLWISLGIKYPKQYIIAWVDLTKGYYYSGHYYWMCSYDVKKNDIGVVRTVESETVRQSMAEYAENFIDPNKNPILNIFVSVGLMFWIMTGAAVVAISKKNWRAAFVFIPIILVVLSLLIATPVYSEFRYVYSLFVSLPMVGLLLCNYEEMPSKEEEKTL